MAMTDRAQAAANALTGKAVAPAKVLEWAEGFCRHAGVQALNEEFGTSYADMTEALAGLSNEQKAGVLVVSLRRAGVAIYSSVKRDIEKQSHEPDWENAEAAAKAEWE